jgi:hypothetical protein
MVFVRFSSALSNVVFVHRLLTTTTTTMMMMKEKVNYLPMTAREYLRLSMMRLAVQKN